MITADELLAAYRRMALIRRFEERAGELYRDGEVPGFLHLSIGQEAAAVGACWGLDDHDVITSTHRGHGHCIAKGLDVASMFAELMGREPGTCRGRGGSMHIADPERGIFGANGIVAAGLPIAGGAALASRITGTGAVAMAFFGDGAIAQGAFHEAVQLAVAWRLPVVFVCENNGYAEFSRSTDLRLGERAAGYGLPFTRLDGNDVHAVIEGMAPVIDRARSGAGPAVVLAETYRMRGHYEGDPERYRPPAEPAGRDPLLVARGRLTRMGVPAERMDAVLAGVDDEVESAIAWARRQADPHPDTLPDFVHVPRTPVPEPPAPGGDRDFKVREAVTAALTAELDGDPTVVVAGIDVGAGGNVFGLTRGLADRFPGRVLDAPISESALVGAAVGAAMAGIRPVVEVMYLDFVAVCLDQLVNQAAKMRFMTGGRASLPLVVRTQFGAGKSSGAQHSQSLEAVLAHIPGLTVVMPSTAADTYGLLRSAIRDPNPVIFIENRGLYGASGPRPEPGHLIPIGRAAVVRPGSDVTVVSYSRILRDCLAVAGRLATEGVSVEVIDLRTIAPLDRTTILESLARTNRLVVVHEAVRDFGVGAEIAAMAVAEGFWHLDAPVLRVGAEPTPAPYSPVLERAWLPGHNRIEAAIRRSLEA